MNPIIRLCDGSVQGRVENGVSVFRGIPYAAAPFGPNRFGPPMPSTGWNGVRAALDFGPTPPKPVWAFESVLPDPMIAGDDCLNLNVWTPDPGAANLPVFVWIYGGGFVAGSSAVTGYDGRAFARDGIVFVSINYRLGVDGFSFIEGQPCNRGLLDQVAALTWVRDNIAAFGGDPDRVTIAGESAGAMSVVTLMAMPQAEGLFHQAIAQSGAGHHVHTLETATEVTDVLAADLGVAPTAVGLGSVDVPRMTSTQDAVYTRLTLSDEFRWRTIRSSWLAFQPVVDGSTLPEPPIEGIADGRGADVKLLIGTNANESAFFTVPTGVYDVLDRAALDHLLTLLEVDPAMTDLYREARGQLSAADMWVAIHSDHQFRVPAVRVAEARSQGPAPTFMYEFAWRSPEYGGRLGASHILDVPFVFDNLADHWGVALRGQDAPQSLADAMHGAWVSFVKTGSPGWQEYGNDRATARFTLHEPEVVFDIEAAIRTAWDGVR